MKYIAIVFILLLLIGCESSSSSTVENASGETQVKYIICSEGGTGCFVAARFKDLDGCESHKDWADMLCKKMSTPGVVTCTPNNDSFASAYCTF